MDIGHHVYRTPDGFWVYTTPNTVGWEFFKDLPDTYGIPGDVISIGKKPDVSNPPVVAVYSSAESWEDFLESPDASPDFFEPNSAFIIWGIGERTPC